MAASYVILVEVNRRTKLAKGVDSSKVLAAVPSPARTLYNIDMIFKTRYENSLSIFLGSNLSTTNLPEAMAPMVAELAATAMTHGQVVASPVQPSEAAAPQQDVHAAPT